MHWILRLRLRMTAKAEKRLHRMTAKAEKRLHRMTAKVEKQLCLPLTAYCLLSTVYFLLVLSLSSSTKNAQGYDATEYLYSDMA